VQISVLKPNEWTKLAPIYATEGGNLPNPIFSSSIVAEDDKGIAGFWGIELVPHAGPLYIRTDLRGTGLWKELNERLNVELGSGYYVYVQPGSATEKICEKLGMTNTGWTVWKKEIK
jgi:hypothetical protein